MSKSAENLEAILKKVAEQYDLSSEKWDDDYELRQAEIRQLFELLAGKRPLPVKIKRLHPDAVIPQYAKPGDAGFDLVAVEDVIVEPGETVKVPTGLAFELPEGYELQIRPRSGITLKTKLRVQLGTVDAGYRGEVGVIVDNIASNYYEQTTDHIRNISGDYVKIKVPPITRPMGGGAPLGYGMVPINTYIIRKGDKIAQGVIAPIQQAEFIEVDELSDSERGAGGFGSTGVKSE